MGPASSAASLTVKPVEEPWETESEERAILLWNGLLRAFTNLYGRGEDRFVQSSKGSGQCRPLPERSRKE